MALFQTSVLKRELEKQDKTLIEKAYKKFKKYFFNPSIQENIRNSKEEQFQEGFLRELFVNVFGYTINPSPDYNLTTEFRNLTGRNKADGAILVDGKAIAVIELKSTKVKDLEEIRIQAFDYKAHHPTCKYIITSTFDRLRFYIDNSVDYEEFDLFNISEQRFELLYFCLTKDNLLENIPLQTKEASVIQEEKVTKQLYADYSLFKREIFRDIVKKNMQNPLLRELTDKDIKKTLFKKTQKLLDKFLFIFFAEDRDLLPPNSITAINDKWEDDVAFGEEKSLYEIYKSYFHILNVGRPKKGNRPEIFAYNGGLFKPDAILDSLIIDDKLLEKHTAKLTKYDFETDIDVNILGHIFENSLNEIESINAEIEGVEFDKQKTKRKKDGVFYTPKYITKYIVDNTLGKLCKDKKEELKIDNIDFSKNYYLKNSRTIKEKILATSSTGKKIFEIKKRKTFLSIEGENFLKSLSSYRQWLFSLSVLDPACGSGAFLNQALDFLIAEHRLISELEAKIKSKSHKTGEVETVYEENIENTILENNIYGVDLNEESVEIAKLSLWLRTAQKGRKLTSLSSNIKCGNSLIDDPKVAGDKAFNWQKEFPTVFQEKKKKAWHITTATHNSRYSQRMFDNNVKTGEAVWIDEKDEIIITKTIAKIVKESKLDNNGTCPIDILEYNICGDHMHLLLVCEEEEVSKIIGKIKGRTARERNCNKGINPLVRPDGDDSRKGGEKAISLWTQKFGKSEIKDEKYLKNTIEYIRNNRIKHELPENKEIEKIKKEFLTTKDQAFSTEYKGGFNVVIGNPPYVRIQGLKENYKKESEFYEQNYQAATANYDIYALFIEKAFKLIKKNGDVCFIQPHKFLISDFGVGIRRFLLENNAVEELLHFGSSMVFHDASTYTCILKLSYNNKEIKFKHIEPRKINTITGFDTISYDKLSSGKWNLTNNNITKVLDKLKQQPLTVKDVFAKVFQGIATSGDKVYLIKGEEKNGYVVGYSQQLDKTVNIEKGFVKPMLKGEDISKYKHLENKYWVIFPYLLNDGKAEPMTEDYIKNNFPKGYEYLKENETFLRGRERHRFDNDKEWFLFGRKQGISNVEQEKIITPDISFGSNMSFDEGKFYHGTTLYSFIKKQEIKQDYKFYLAVLNSSILWFYIKNTGTELRGGYFRFKTNYLNPFPLPKLNNIDNQQPFIEKAEQMLKLNKQLQEKKIKFLNRAKDNLFTKGINPLDLKPSKKLEAFYDYDFKTFVSELKKKKIKLSLVQQDEWEEYFNTYKTEMNHLQSQINQTDKTIDQMVYELYGLTDEEIKIVEGAN